MKIKQKTGKTKLVKIQRVIERVADEFGVDALEIVSQEQGPRAVSTARYVACYLLRDVLDRTQLAVIMGRRTYNYACGASKWVRKHMDKDDVFFRRVLKLENADV